MHSSGQDHLPWRKVQGRPSRRGLLDEELFASWQPASCGGEPQVLTVVSEHEGAPGTEEPHRAVCDGLEHRLYVRLRDCAQDIGGGCLTLERLAEVLVARLQLRE